MNRPNVTDISPGVRLCCVPTDRFKTSRLFMSMAVPMSGGSLSANAVLPYILHRSCAEYPDFSALNGVLDDLYGAVLSGSVSKLGDAQVLAITISSLDDRFALSGERLTKLSAELLLKLVFSPDLKDGFFTDEALEREKRLLTEKLESENDDKQLYALNRCEEIMCADEPRGRSKYGSLDEIAALTPDAVTSAWQNALETAVFQFTVVSGDGSPEIAAALREAFAGINRRPSEIRTRFGGGTGEVKNVSETQPVKQGKLVMGFRSSMRDAFDDAAAMIVMTDLFGGGTYSKLFSEVREKQSLCYYCSARLERQKGIVVVQSGIETQNRDRAVDEILRQLDALKNGDFSDAELSSSLLALADKYSRSSDTPETVVGWYASQTLFDSLITPEEEAAKIARVTREDVIRAARGIKLDTIFMLEGTGGEDENQ